MALFAGTAREDDVAGIYHCDHQHFPIPNALCRCDERSVYAPWTGVVVSCSIIISDEPPAFISDKLQQAPLLIPASWHLGMGFQFAGGELNGLLAGDDRSGDIGCKEAVA